MYTVTFIGFGIKIPTNGEFGNLVLHKNVFLNSYFTAGL